MPETNCNMLAWFALLRICRNSRLPERREVSFCYGLRFISSPHAESSVLPSSVCVCSIATVSRNKSSFLLLPPSIHLSAAVDWPCQSAHYRHLPSPGSAHLISLARPRPLPSFTFSLLLLILARRDFGFFCGIGANSSPLLPSSFRRRRRQLCPSPPRSAPEEEGDGLGASVTRRERALPLPRIDGWMDGSVFWSIGDVFAIPSSRLCRVAKCLSMMLLLLLGRRRVILVVLQRVRVRGHCRGVEPRL